MQKRRKSQDQEVDQGHERRRKREKIEADLERKGRSAVEVGLDLRREDGNGVEAIQEIEAEGEIDLDPQTKEDLDDHDLQTEVRKLFKEVLMG